MHITYNTHPPTLRSAPASACERTQGHPCVWPPAPIPMRPHLAVWCYSDAAAAPGYPHYPRRLHLVIS
eukprot:1154957-Pelagomonas_calceolata.AAC.3